MAQYVGFGVNAEQDLLVFEAEESRRQALIAECMVALDLPYEALPGGFNVFAPDRGASGTAELGLVEAFQRSRDRASGLPIAQDPNDVRAASLTDEDRDTYYRALYGVGWEDLDQDAADFANSCTGRAYAEVPGTAAAAADLRAQYWRERDSAIDSAPEVEAALEDWRQCMDARGFPVLSRGSLYGLIEGWIVDEIDQHGELSRQAQVRLGELEAHAFAAHQECGAGLARAEAAVGMDFDKQFADDHSDELAEFLPGSVKP